LSSHRRPDVALGPFRDLAGGRGVTGEQGAGHLLHRRNWQYNENWLKNYQDFLQRRDERLSYRNVHHASHPIQNWSSGNSGRASDFEFQPPALQVFPLPLGNPMKAFFSVILLLATGLLCCRTACAHGAYHEELQRTDELIAASPDNAELWFHRGYLNFLHGDWRQSLLDVEQAERLAPGKHPVGLVRGQALMAGDQFEAARAVLDEFVRSHPEVSEGYAARARVLLKLAKPDEAVADFEAALAKLTHPEPDLYVETADAMIAQKHPENAVRVLQAGMRKLGEIPSLALKALELESALGLYDAALSRVAAMQKTAPRPEPWMARRADLLTQAGRTEEARAAWTALRDRIAGLPNLERGSHAMSVLAERADKALANPLPTTSQTIATPTPTPR